MHLSLGPAIGGRPAALPAIRVRPVSRPVPTAPVYPTRSPRRGARGMEGDAGDPIGRELMAEVRRGLRMLNRGGKVYTPEDRADQAAPGRRGAVRPAQRLGYTTRRPATASWWRTRRRSTTFRRGRDGVLHTGGVSPEDRAVLEAVLPLEGSRVLRDLHRRGR